MAIPVPNANARPRGSGTEGNPEICVEKLVTLVVSSRFTFTVNAKPSVVSLVNTGIVPAESENMLNANVLPEVDTPSGELNAGPYRLNWNDSVQGDVQS